MNSVVRRFRGTSVFDVIRAGQISGGFLGENPGRDYYVNNITGSDSMNGRSWARAFAGIAAAVSASEAYRARQASLNQYIRNRIFIQGTGSPYASLTALPSYCDMIGLGADPRGNGAGIARIGADSDGEGAEDGVNADAARGLNMYNLQFQAGSGKVAFDIDKIYRARFENCAFMAGHDAISPAAGLLIGTTGTWGYGASGLVLKDCHISTGHASDLVIGLSIAGTHFHNCEVIDCLITGTTGILVASVCTATFGSRVKGCDITHGYGLQTASINDDATEGHIHYSDCRVAVKPTMVNNADKRAVGIVVVDETAFSGGFSDS